MKPGVPTVDMKALARIKIAAFGGNRSTVFQLLTNNYPELSALKVFRNNTTMP
jgi:hypothetical protein